MSARINYNRITGSNIQGDATTVTEPLGTLVVTNNGDLRLHDGTTQGGVAVSGSGGGFATTSTLVNGDFNFTLGPDGTVNFDPSSANGKGVLQTSADLQFIAVDQAWTFSTNSNLTVPGTIVGNSGALDLNYDGSVVLSGIPSVDAVIQTTTSGSSNTSTWTFGTDGALTLPQGSVIGETNNTTVITPPTANPGQSLVIRPTASFYLSASGYIVPGENLIITLTNSNNASVDTTYINYTITDAVASQLGLSSLTGHFPYLSPSATNPQSASIVLPIPLNSSALTFTLTIDSDQPAGSANVTITVTSNGIFNNELSHVHLVAGNPSVVDLYLGDDDQYVKIEKNQGNVVVGTNLTTTTSTWTFGTDGVLTLSTASTILGNSTDPNVYIETSTTATTSTWTFGTDGVLTLPAATPIIKGGGTGTDVTVIASTGSNTSTWVFGADGTTTFPNSRIDVKDDLTLRVLGVPNAVTGLTGSPQGGWSGSYTNLTTTGGSGTGLTVNASESGSGYIDTVTIATPGHGYTNGDVITITSGGATAYFTISILPAQSWTLGGDGVLTFPGEGGATLSNDGEFRIWTTSIDITVYRNGQDGYGVSEGEVNVFANNNNITKTTDLGFEIVQGYLKFPDSTVQTTAFTGPITPPALASLLSTATTIAITDATEQNGPATNITVEITNHQLNHYGTTSYTDNIISTGLVVIPDTTQSPPIDHSIMKPGTVQLIQTYNLGVSGSPANSHYIAYAYVVTPFGTVWSAPTSGTLGSVCLIEGTMISLADGSYKAIEDITYTDSMLSWNFDQGCYAETKAVWIKRGETGSQYNLLTFSDGTTLRTFDQHRIFNKQAGAFTYPMTDATPIGTITVNEHGQEITLVDKQVIVDTIEYYNVITDYHMNLFSDSILTSCRFNNIYPITDMKFVKDGRTLRTRDEFENIPDRFFYGLRLAEQTTDIETVEWYVNRLLSLEQSSESVVV